MTPSQAITSAAAAEQLCCSASKQVIALLVVGAIVRLALVWAMGSQPPVITDARDYDGLAMRILDTGSYIDEQGQPTSLRPPLYPTFVAIVYKVAGKGNYLAVSAAQAAVSLLTVLLTFYLGRDVYGEKVGLAAAAIMCLYPTLLVYNQLLLSEVLFTMFVAAGALLSVRVAKKGSLKTAALLGVSLGLGALTRSVMWLFAPVLAFALALLGSARPARRLTLAMTMAAAFAGTIAPWVYRNTKLQDTLTFIDVMGGRNVMMGNYEYTPLERSWATIETETGDREWVNVLLQQMPNHGPLTQGQIDKAAMSYGVKYFFSNPWQSLQRSIVKFFNFWQLEREIVAGMRQGLYGTASMPLIIGVGLLVCGVYAALLFAAIFGGIMTPPQRQDIQYLLLGWIAFPCMVHTIAFAHSRYHLPLLPILSVFAAAAFVQRSDIWPRRESWRFRIASLACVIVAASWLREFLVVDLKWFV